MRHVTLSKNEKSCEVEWLSCVSQAVVFWSCDSQGDLEMWWNIDWIRVSSISSQAPSCFLRSKIQTRIKVRSIFFASPKSHVHQVEVESFVSFFLNFVPITIPPTPLLRLVQGLFSGMCHSCTIDKLVWHTLHCIRKCYRGWKLSAEPTPQNAHLRHIVVSNRGGLEGGHKAEKLVSSSISTTNPILLSECNVI